MMFKIVGNFLLLISFLFFSPLNTFAADVLQVRSSSTLQIGDRNRTYTVKLACLEIDPSGEDSAIDFLKSELKRKTRVNLNPQGTSEGMLIARVNILKSKIDIGQYLAEKGFGEIKC